jgi:CheY-like chemotaxis protein/predicted regulator of Ras-like GTPase activity (Roadblock/LC7/MglB family)
MEAKKNILIVDDDSELAYLLAQAVSDVAGEYDVQVAHDVDGAMVQVNRAQSAQTPFDLVITDIKMLGLSGLELLEALESIAPDTKTITMTAYNSPELAERAQELNVYAYLTKPFVLSEFRQIVRSALYPTPADDVSRQDEQTHRLTTPQQAAVGKHLATLRAMTGTNAALLMHRTGAQLAIDAQETDLDVSRLCEALMYTQQVIAEQMAETLNTDSPIRQSYFGTETFSVCTYRLDDDHVMAVVFGPAVREGQVWYYMRDAASKVTDALNATDVPGSVRPRKTDDVFDMLDRFFPEYRTTRPNAPRSEVTSAVERTEALSPRAQEQEGQQQTEPEPAQESPQQTTPEHEQEISQRTDPETTSTAPRQPALSPPAADLPSIDDIDWSAAPSANWDEVVEEADPRFEGMTLEEAQSQGLLAPELLAAFAPPAQPDQQEPSDGDRSLEGIDWDSPIDASWDEIAATTDQGFQGMSFEEAKRQGIVGDVKPE